MQTDFPGRRFVVKVVNPDLHKGKPYAPLLEKKSKSGGRNNNGRITTRHIGGGHKQHYRMVDFKRDKDGIPALSSASNTIRTVPPHRPAAVRRRRASLHHRPKGVSRRSAAVRAMRRSSRATACRCATSRWVPPCTASK
jgi:hypothetical protein